LKVGVGPESELSESESDDGTSDSTALRQTCTFLLFYAPMLDLMMEHWSRF